mgnify:CR=1 FL=1
MQTLQEIQNAFGIFMEEQEYEKLQEPEKLTEKNDRICGSGYRTEKDSCYGDIDFKSGTFYRRSSGGF